MLKEYIIENTTNKTVEKCNYIWKKNEIKKIKLNDLDLFRINACTYLKVYENGIVEEEKEELIDEKNIPDNFVCPKCGKKYKDSKYYSLHIQKCKVKENNHERKI